MKDRLIELLEEKFPNMRLKDAYSVADHLLSEGVIVPPVKVGQVVYCPIKYFLEPEQAPYVHEEKVTGVAYELMSDNSIEWSVAFGDGEWETLGGEYVKLTREEAEKVLDERSENGKS